MANPTQLFLLADHIKLSLLERQRAISLNLEPNAQDGQISRSLESLREGLEGVQKERVRLEERQDGSSTTLHDQESRLRGQFDDLTAQFRGFPAGPSSLNQPNDPSLAADFSQAQDPRPRMPSSSSFLRRPDSKGNGSPKSVQFSDVPGAPPTHALDEANDSHRAALFPYRDDPDTIPDHEALDNQQIHAYHSRVIEEQDAQLDQLGESIGRQRELSIQIGDELDSHVQLLDEVDEHVDRHQTRLDQARKRLGTFARKAKDNMQLTIIFVMIVILVLLIVVLK
ncbi:MAG: hypothetical protein M1838_003972 [Thelocarpon superellum]|nr:MAG: hypothetical protein M1838_003972 [Thelocarpon superellum]